MAEPEKLLVEVAVPFCTGRCCFCPKQSFGQNIGYLQRYRNALEKEVFAAGEDLGSFSPWSVHLSMDTPSLFGVGALDGFLGRLREGIPGEDAEWVVNLCPQEVQEEILHVLFGRQGIDRVRLFMMATRKEDLKALHLPFTSNLVTYALQVLKEKGKAFSERFCIELMAGVPGQSLKDWEETLREVLESEPGQVSLWKFRGRTWPVEKQLAYAEETPWGDYLGIARDTLEKAGYEAVTRMVYAKPGMCLRMDLPMAKELPVMGFGIGAGTRVGGGEYHNTTDYSLYVEHSTEPDVIAVF